MKTDCLIIGAGAVGLVTAHALVKQDLTVTLVDQSAIAQEASWAGAGILLPLLPWNYPPAVTRLTGASLSLYPELVRELYDTTGIDPELRHSGMLILPDYNAPSAFNWCHNHEFPITEVRAPDIASSVTLDKSALWLESVMQLRNPRFLAAMRGWLMQHGVHLLEHATGAHLISNGRRILGVQANQGHFSAESYVVTAGAWSQQLLGEHALGLDIRPIRGQMLLYKAHPGQLETIVMQNGTYIVPRADGHILVGSTLEDAGFDKSTTDEARRSLHTTATTLLPFLNDTPLIGHWAGLRPGSPGNIPTISRHPTLENLYINSGHFRYGVTMAPASARLLLDLMLDRPPLLDPTPYQWPAAHQHQHNIL